MSLFAAAILSAFCRSDFLGQCSFGCFLAKCLKYIRVLLGCWAKANDGEHLVKVNMKDMPILLLEFVCNSRILLLPRT